MGVFNGKEWKIFFTFWIVYSAFSMYITWNENTRLDLTLAVVEEGRFSIDSYYKNTGDRSFFKGHYYTDKMPGMSFIDIPVYVAFKFFFGTPELHYHLYNVGVTDSWLLFVLLSIIFTSALFGSLSVVLVYKISDYFTNKELHRNLIVIVYGFGTLIFVYSRFFYDHVTSAFFAFLCFYLIFKMKYDKNSRDYSFLAGLAGGLAVLVSIPSIFLVFGCFIMLILFKSIRRTALFLLGFVLVMLILMFYNNSAFGHPLHMGYDYPDPQVVSMYPDECRSPKTFEDKIHCEALEKKNGDICNQLSGVGIDKCLFFIAEYTKNNSFCQSINDSDWKAYCDSIIVFDPDICDDIKNESMRTRCVGSSQKSSSYFLGARIKNLLYFFKPDRLNVMMRLLVFPYRGLFFYYPILIFSIIGLFFMYKSYKVETLLIVLFFLSFLLLNARIFAWWGGFCFGPRHLTALMPFLMIPLLFSFKKIKMNYIIPFIVISLFFNLLSVQYPEEAGLGKSVDNFIPFGNPLFEHYLPSLLKYGPRSTLLEQALNFQFKPFVNVALLLLIIYFIWRKK